MRKGKIFILALALSAMARAAESPQDSAAENLSLYEQVVDSLQSAAEGIPENGIVDAKPCTTTAKLICRSDYVNLVEYFKTQKQFAASVEAKLRTGILRYEDYV